MSESENLPSVDPESAAASRGRVEAQIARKEARRLRAKSDEHHRIWFGLGMFGLVGWSVTIPTLIGTAIGIWLDSKFEGRQSWTLMLLIIGLVIGCLNAWRWLKDESDIRDDR